jgi:succinate dehydrogenase/fumarate reductase-like Fe-S protein
MIEKATVKIWRFDPAVNAQARYEIYHLPPGNWDRVKVIDALRYIYENCDPGISFREPCRQGYCKACAVKINNKVRLACQVFLEEETVIEPAPNRTVIKDIVTV